MPKITKTQKYAISWLSHNGMNPDDIATELNLPLKQVLSNIEKSEKAAEPEKEGHVTHKISAAKDLMITHTSGKKINSVAIMTKEASEIGDSSRQNMPIKKKDSEKGIFRPKK